MQSINLIGHNDENTFDPQILTKLLNITDRFFWSKTESRLLYHDLIHMYNEGLQESNFQRYIKQVYLVLIAWGMDSRGAKLVEFPIFLDSLQKSQVTKLLQELRDYTVIDVMRNLQSRVLEDDLKDFFTKVNLLENNNSSHFVSYSKTLHLLFPKLITPMDRANTLTFYNRDLPSKNIEGEFRVFFEIQKDMWKFTEQNIKHLERILSQHEDDLSFNRTIPKIIDNLIIGEIISKKKIISDSLENHCLRKKLVFIPNDLKRKKINEYF